MKNPYVPITNIHPLKPGKRQLKELAEAIKNTGILCGDSMKRNLNIFTAAKRIELLEEAIGDEIKELSINGIIRDKAILKKLGKEYDDVSIASIKVIPYGDGTVEECISLRGCPKNSKQQYIRNCIGVYSIKIDKNYNTLSQTYFPTR